MSPRAKRRVGIFWDVENCGVPSKIPPRVIAARIKAVVKNFGEIVKFNAYGDSQHTCLLDKQDELREAADIIAFALGYTAPVAVILISSDGDFSHAVSIIQDKGHIVWIISNLRASSKLVGLADGRMSWNDDIIDRAYEIPRNSEPPHLQEEDEEALQNNRIVNLCDNAAQMAIGSGYSCSVLPCQTSTTSYYASSSVRPAPVQTFSCLSIEGGHPVSYSPVSIITSTPFLNTYTALRKPDPPPPPVAQVTEAPLLPEPAPVPPLRVQMPPSKRAPTTDKFHSKFEFYPLITLLRQLRSTYGDETRKLRGPELVKMLRRRDPSIFKQYKKPKSYLKKARSAGIILTVKEQGHPPTVSLHPDYY